MKKENILNIIESIDNDLKQTYEDILNGKPYRLYFDDLLKAKYDFIRYMNDEGLLDWDLKTIIENDKERFEDR